MKKYLKDFLSLKKPVPLVTIVTTDEQATENKQLGNKSTVTTAKCQQVTLVPLPPTESDSEQTIGTNVTYCHFTEVPASVSVNEAVSISNQIDGTIVTIVTDPIEKEKEIIGQVSVCQSGPEPACPLCNGPLKWTVAKRYVYGDCPRGHHASIGPTSNATWLTPDVELIIDSAESAPSLVDTLRADGWNEEAAELIAWVWLAELPPEPFPLRSGHYIAEPQKWYRSLLADINAGPRGPRARRGVLQQDLRDLFHNVNKGKAEQPETAEVVQFPKPNYFGNCPRCGRNNGHLNLGREHWFICHAHKVKWCAGLNLFSGWLEETEELWQKNKALLSGYREIEPRKAGRNYFDKAGKEFVNEHDSETEIF